MYSLNLFFSACIEWGTIKTPVSFVFYLLTRYSSTSCYENATECERKSLPSEGYSPLVTGGNGELFTLEDLPVPFVLVAVPNIFVSKTMITRTKGGAEILPKPARNHTEKGYR